MAITSSILYNILYIRIYTLKYYAIVDAAAASSIYILYIYMILKIIFLILIKPQTSRGNQLGVVHIRGPV